MILGRITKCLAALMAAIALNSCSNDPLNIAETRPPTGSEARQEQEVLRLVNQYRQRNGKSRLSKSKELQLLARSHSQDMASGDRKFGHGGVRFRFSYASNLYRVENMGELVGYTTRSDAAPWIFQQWLGSSGHNEQMVKPAKIGAAGVARSPSGKTYITFLLATERESSSVKGPNVALDRYGNPL